MAKKLQVHGNLRPEGSSNSWNDLTDKPFGETTVKGDTLTWDGNTEGLVSINIGTDAYKVSNATPTMTDFANGAVIKYSHSQEDVYCTEDGGTLREHTPGLVMVDGGGVVVIGESLAGMDMGNGIPLEAGTYFNYSKDSGQYTASITIPNYTGFETTTIKTIDPKYLPEASSSDINEEETLELLMDMDVVQPLSDTNGVVYTDSNNKVYVL